MEGRTDNSSEIRRAQKTFSIWQEYRKRTGKRRIRRVIKRRRDEERGGRERGARRRQRARENESRRKIEGKPEK